MFQSRFNALSVKQQKLFTYHISMMKTNWINLFYEDKILLAQAALRAPHEVVFAMCSWPLLLPSFSLFVFFISSLFSVFCLWPTSGKLPCAKELLPQYFGITRRYMQKKYFWGVNFIFLRKKLFSAVYDQRSVTAAWATRSPWNITW